MVNGYEISRAGVSAVTGVTATTVDLLGIPDKFGGGVDFTRWQKKMKLWLTLKGLWPVIQYEKPVLNQENFDSIKVYSTWEEKDETARAYILAALTNTLSNVYSSDAYTAKLLWKKLDQTHNTDSQRLETYYVARYLDFKPVDSKSMIEQAYEFEILMNALKDLEMNLPEKFQVMSLIEKLPNSWEKFALFLKRRKEETTWTNLMLEISMHEQHKFKHSHVMPDEYENSKVNLVNVKQKRRYVNKKENNKSKLEKNKTKESKTNKPCWFCGQICHWSKDCPVKKTKKPMW